MSYFDWLINDLQAIREHPRTAVALFMVGALLAWWVRGVTVSNLQSQVALLQTRLEVGPDSLPRPLPSYPLGGSDILVYNSAEWTKQDTARTVELDWRHLAGVDAHAVLRMRSEGDSETWVQGRVLNITDNEVVATSERHTGRPIVVRFRLPRAAGVKTYGMLVRGQNAGLDGVIELRRSSLMAR